MKKISVYFITALLSAGLFACSGPQVTRVESKEEIDLSGYWNDTDSHLVAEEMINDSFANQWFNDFRKANARKPRIIIGLVLNKTEEHISTETFVKDLEKSYVNSGKVTFVASRDQRAEIRAERAEQAINAKAGTAKNQGQETATDFMLKGQINSIFDANKKAQLKYYQVELELINLETNETVWIGQKKIKKVISKKSYKI
ncbi:MAG: penicillin-binding protein activator LpoB [Endomicrobium sp.]|nr:penicillin-binding protein activator LpoB [Endomicrobium sp.]